MFEEAKREMKEAMSTIDKLIAENAKMSNYLSRANSTIEGIKKELAARDEAIINLQNQLLLLHENCEISESKISRAQAEILANSYEARIATTLN